jgi:hypothetical protein
MAFSVFVEMLNLIMKSKIPGSYVNPFLIYLSG